MWKAAYIIGPGNRFLDSASRLWNLSHPHRVCFILDLQMRLGALVTPADISAVHPPASWRSFAQQFVWLSFAAS